MKHPKQTVVSSLVCDTTDTNELLTSILKASTEHCILAIDLEGIILLWNEGAHRIYGYEAREMVGQKKIDALFPTRERTPRKLLEINALVRYGKWEGVLNQQRQNGQIFPARITITPRHDGKKNVVGLLIISNDVSRDIVLEALQFEELKVAQFYTRSLIEANIDILIVTDIKGIITDVNHQMCEVTGQRREEIIGSLFKTYFTDPQQAQEEIHIALMQKTITNEELMLQSQQGKQIAVSCNAKTFHGPHGQAIGVLVTARDVTERKAAEEERALLLEHEQQARITQVEANEQLQHLNELQKNFIAIVSHEFRTSLTGIMGFSELLLQEQELTPAEVRDYATDINTDAQRLNRMITSLLDLGQIQSGKMVLHLEQIEINALLKEVVEHMSVTTQQTILLRLDTSLLFIEGDRDKLIQVITNLLSNAVKYSPKGDDILVTSQRESHNAHVCIKDQGIGIPADALERIFVPYNRIDSDKTRYIQGTGLGLSIVYEIIMMHGGRVWAESTLGQGSQFHFTLPLQNTTIQE
ncbi:MAG TPA: PAS domain-containing sensor histidine kinase [Ktedonobacteraceae bacterium]